MSEFCAYNGSWSSAFLSSVCSCAENESLSMDVAFSLFQLWLFAYKCCRGDYKSNFSARKVLMPAFLLWRSSIKCRWLVWHNSLLWNQALWFNLKDAERCWQVLSPKQARCLYNHAKQLYGDDKSLEWRKTVETHFLRIVQCVYYSWPDGCSVQMLRHANASSMLLEGQRHNMLWPIRDCSKTSGTT